MNEGRCYSGFEISDSLGRERHVSPINSIDRGKSEGPLLYKGRNDTKLVEMICVMSVNSGKKVPATNFYSQNGKKPNACMRLSFDLRKHKFDPIYPNWAASK